jgi:hypothetical protein
MIKTSLHPTLSIPPWIRLANLIAEEPYAPRPPEIAEISEDRELLERVGVRWDELFSHSINAPNGPPLSIHEPIDRRASYELVWVVNLVLKRIAARVAEEEKKGWTLLTEIWVQVPALPSHLDLFIQGDGHGTISSGSLGAFLNMLGAVDLRRIRRCPVCPSLFYARRTNQITCSQSHARTLSIRKWRAHQKEIAQKVAFLAADKHDVKKIASELGISPRLVRQHIASAKKPTKGERG